MSGSADELRTRVEQAKSGHQAATAKLSEAKANFAVHDPRAGRLRDPKTGQFVSDPNNPRSPHKWTDTDRRAAWRRLVEDPNAPLLPEQRKEIIERKYRGPQFDNPITERKETMELSHEPIPRREGGTDVVPRDRRDHAAAEYREHGYSHRAQFFPPDERNYTEAQIEVIREAFWDRDGYKEYDPRTWETSSTTPKANSLTEQAANIAEDVRPSGGALRGASRALGPLGTALDAYSLKEAYDADGGRVGENFKETAGGVVGGMVGGAAMGAAVGSVVPIVGTVVGGIVGGIIGSMVGEEIGEKL